MGLRAGASAPWARAIAVSLVAATAAGVWAVSAEGCTCGLTDPRVRLARVDVSFVGRVVSERRAREPDGRDSGEDRTVFEVRRAYKGQLRRGQRVTVSTPVNGFDSLCGGASWQAGQQGSVVANRVRGRLHSASGCDQLYEPELRRAVRSLRAPERGRAVALAATGLRGPGVMALDRLGRVVAWGRTSGVVEAISVCPGGQRTVETTRTADGMTLVVRDLRSMRVVTRRPAGTLDQITCADRRARTVLGTLWRGATQEHDLVRHTAAGRTVLLSTRDTVRPLGVRHAAVGHDGRFDIVDLHTQARVPVTVPGTFAPLGVDTGGRYALFGSQLSHRLVDLHDPSGGRPPAPGRAAWAADRRSWLAHHGRTVTVMRANGQPMTRLTLPRAVGARDELLLGRRIIVARSGISAPVAHLAASTSAANAAARLSLSGWRRLPVLPTLVVALPADTRVQPLRAAGVVAAAATCRRA